MFIPNPPKIHNLLGTMSGCLVRAKESRLAGESFAAITCVLLYCSPAAHADDRNSRRVRTKSGLIQCYYYPNNFLRAFELLLSYDIFLGRLTF